MYGLAQSQRDMLDEVIKIAKPLSEEYIEAEWVRLGKTQEEMNNEPVAWMVRKDTDEVYLAKKWAYEYAEYIKSRGYSTLYPSSS